MATREESGVEERPGGRLTDHIGLGVLSARFHRDLLEEIINRTGCRERRSRRLPAHVMIRYVIAMGLHFDESYEEVMRRLVGSLRKMVSWVDDWQVPTASAICQARKRLGVAPLKELFDRAAVPVAGLGTKGAWLAGRRLMAIDGTSFDVADTKANEAHFGRVGSGPKASAFPKLQAPRGTSVQLGQQKLGQRCSIGARPSRIHTASCPNSWSISAARASLRAVVSGVSTDSIRIGMRMFGVSRR